MTELVTANRGYQKPRPGQKLKDDVLRLIAALDAIDVDVASVLLALADKSNVGHGHGMEAISGLAAALGNKLDVGHHDALGDLTDVDIAGVANGMALLWQAAKWIPVALQINNIAGLEAALNAKATPADITNAINALVAAAPGALNTLDELAAALGDDPNFAATISAALGNRVRFDAAQTTTNAQKLQALSNLNGLGYLAQTLSAAQKLQARQNIGADDAANITTGLINVDRIPDYLSRDKAYRQGNIIGTATHSGGVPTGGIIEQGGNANGSYTRFADGTQFCWGNRSAGTWNYPALFQSAPSIVGTSLTAAQGILPMVSNVSASSAALATQDTNPPATRTGHTCHWIAIGRWF